ncbi:LysR family transcriptional regulator [Motilibacter deserti]|uniref:LysR family transcriptional regulator n=1 Tax=Motilibacter deserti TaxID=2714956 RepID=A0ABX0GYA3_9ACTN|nr:LysR family transcriptional regulator [Motilibacter deserti]
MTPTGSTGPSDVSRLTPNRLRVYVTVVDRQSIRAAAQELTLSEVAVRQNLAELTEVTGGSSLLTRGGSDGRLVVPTVHGRRVYAAAGTILAQAEALARLGSTQHVLAFAPQHAFFVAPAWRAVEGGEHVELRLLEDGDNGGARAEERALRSLEEGVYDLVVGAPGGLADRHPTLRSELLFTAHVEALAPVAGQARGVDLADLRDSPLLLPPPSVRGRQVLESAFTERYDEKPVVALECADPASLVAFARQGAGTVVLGSDVSSSCRALPAGDGQWAPVLVEGERLTYPVVVVTRQDPGPVVQALCRQLHAAVADSSGAVPAQA